MNASQTESHSILGLLRATAVQALPACNSQPEPTPPAAPQRMISPEDCLIIRVRKIKESMGAKSQR